jgi:hypothetical protein
MRSTGTKRSFGRNLNNSVSSDKSSNGSSDLSLSNIDKVMSKGSKKKKSRKGIEKLFMTEKKARFSNSIEVNDPLMKKCQSGGSENIEKALDDMLLMGPILRSSEKSESKREKDTEMLPPRDRKGKMKKLARKKRLEKLLEAKNKQK